MYIFIEQLEVRGRSLQGGANQLSGYGPNTQLFPLTNACSLQRPHLGWSSPQKPVGKGSGGRGRPLHQAGDSALPGGKACFPNRMLAMLRIWFQKQSFRKDCGTAKMEPTQLLEKDLTEELRQKAKF